MRQPDRPQSPTDRHQRPAVYRSGLHTVSFAWRPKSEEFWADVDCAIEARHLKLKKRSAPRPDLYKYPQPIGGGRWFVDPFNRMLYCEDPLQSFVSGADDLCPPSSLPAAAWNAAVSFADASPSFPIDCVPLLRRTDVAVDLQLAREMGQELLVALHNAGPPSGFSAHAYPGANGIQSVEWFHGKRVIFRAYVRGSTPAGDDIFRLERQITWVKRKQPEPTAFNPAHFTFAEFIRTAPPESQRLDMSRILDVLERRAKEGEINEEALRRLAGAAALLVHSGRTSWSCARSARRAIFELRKHGIEVHENDERTECRPVGAPTLREILSLSDRAVLSMSDKSTVIAS